MEQKVMERQFGNFLREPQNHITSIKKTTEMKIKQYILVFTCAALAVGCQNEEFEAQRADGYDEIRFSANVEKMITRATYSPWNKDIHPTSMGVFGFYEPAALFMEDVKINYDNNTWSYANITDRKYWADFSDKRYFDFFAFMPYVEGAKMKWSNNEFTLSVPFTPPSPILKEEDSKSFGLICQMPQRTEPTDNAISFNMDQTLTGFSFLFTLSNKMSELRTFRIKKINVSGKLPAAGTVLRKYTYKNGWTTGDIEWTINSTKDVDKACVYQEENGIKIVRNSQSEAIGTFYVIPSSDFYPTIEVEYDVLDNDRIVRTATNTIVFNKDNFKSYIAAAKTGTINTIKINIVPDHLYILADDDQNYGVLVAK